MSLRIILPCLLPLLAISSLRGDAVSLPNWQPTAKQWSRSLGSHRVIVRVDSVSEAVRVKLPWRRRDVAPETKAILVHDLKSNQEIANVVVVKNTAEAGEILFQPKAGPGEYAVYFLPVKIDGGAFPTSKPIPPQDKAEAAWKQSASTTKNEATIVRWEALTANDAWTDMEVIATESETKAMAKSTLQAAFLPAEKSVRMFDRLPAIFAKAEAWNQPAEVTVRPGGSAVFQIMAWAPLKPLSDVKVGIPATKAAKFTCLSTDGVDWLGKPYTRTIGIEKGHVQPFWFSVEVPANAAEGEFVHPISLGAKQAKPSEMRLKLIVKKEATTPEDADPTSLTRLRWLNSTTAVDNEPTKGYTPLVVQGKTIRCLGREVTLGDDGLPTSAASFFDASNIKILDKPTRQLLAGAMKFQLAGAPLKAAPMKFTSQAPGLVEWQSEWTNASAKVILHGSMEFDGSLHYQLEVTQLATETTYAQAELSVPRTVETCRYVIGLDRETGFNDKQWSWKWDVVNRNQDSVWMGAVNGGMRLQLHAENYVRPGVNIHYRKRPLNDPPSWNASKAGGMTYSDGMLKATSGAFTLKAGESRYFNFDLLVTPFHTLQTKEQWQDRYYHTSGVPQDTAKYLDSAKAAGANVVNIHQGNWLNPYINYPFRTADKLGAFAAASHERGMRTKFYYTVRELSNWAPEIFALRSMGDNCLLSGKGGGHPWGEEHLNQDYWQAWYEPGVQDVSILTQPMCRWHNYYIEGLKFLCEKAGCDGIYLDDIAYDRSIMLRARKVLDRYCPRGGLIDLHSWNEYNDWACRARCANIFMDSLPFVDRMWFGEGHHYSGPPAEHFLVEISGIPYGLMGEMLEGGGNPWLGMVHGMTGRLGWGGDPKSAWRLWDEFGVQDAEFIGYWAEDACPVRTNEEQVKATVWKKNDATLVAVANFSGQTKPTQLTVDWKALGRDPAKTKLHVLGIPELKQREALLEANKPLSVKAHAGVIFVLDELPHDIAAAPAPTSLGPVLEESDFAKAPDAIWKLVASEAAKKGSRSDGGFVFQSPANQHAFLERALPASCQAVAARIWQDGKDEGQQWGPGFALVWPTGQTLKVSVRKDGRLSVAANGNDDLSASITTRAVVELTIRWDEKSVHVLAGGPAMGDLTEEIASFPKAKFPGQPGILRVGKMPSNAQPQDHGDAGPVGFNRIEWVRLHGK